MAIKMFKGQKNCASSLKIAKNSNFGLPWVTFDLPSLASKFSSIAILGQLQNEHEKYQLIDQNGLRCNFIYSWKSQKPLVAHILPPSISVF